MWSGPTDSLLEISYYSVVNWSTGISNVCDSVLCVEIDVNSINYME